MPNQFNLTSPDFLADIQEFHEHFNLAYDGPPRDLRHAYPGTDLGPKLQEFRRKFITEEFVEFLRAEAKEDAAEEFDACLDMIYVILGYCYLRGWPVAHGWDRVHAANMTKVRVAPDHPQARSAWDVRKPAGFVPPNLSDLVIDV